MENQNNGWQPIETIPKNDIVLVYMNEPDLCGRIYPMSNNTNVSMIGHRFDFDVKGTPTHWMPLPEPPSN